MMKQILLLLLCVSCATSPNKDHRKSLIHTELGTSALEKANYPQAFRELLTAVQLDPNNAIAHNNLGLAFFMTRKIDRCEVEFQKAIDLIPNYTDAINNLGRLYIEQKRYDEALLQFKKASTDLTYPNPEKILANLGTTYFLLGKYQLAHDKLRDAILTNRKFCPAHEYLGQSLFHLKQYDKAAKALDHALALCKENRYEDVQFYSALAYFKLGEREKARARLVEFLEFYPTSAYDKEAKEYLKQL